MSRLQERFYDNVGVICNSGTQSATSSTTAKLIADSTVTLLPKEAANGTCIEWTIAGTKTNANNGFTITLLGGGATLLTLTSDASTASDWNATILLRFTNPAVQKIVGVLLLDTEDPEVNYAGATTDFSGGGQISAYVTAVNGSDLLYAEMCIVKKWVM